MDFSVLGRLSVRSGSRSAAPTAPKQRQLLALLLLNSNHVVRTETLVRELWGITAPNTSTNILQTYVAQLRGLIMEVSGHDRDYVTKGVLLTEQSGYLLRLAPGQLDLDRFQARLAAARAALAVGDPGAAAEFGAALALWDGDPLGDVPHGAALTVQVRRLEQLWLGAVEQWFALELDLGRPHEILPELTAVAAEHPLHENIHRQLMIALCQAGRRAAAVQCYQSLRRRLHDELGLAVSESLERLYRQIRTPEPLFAVSGDRLRGGSPVCRTPDGTVRHKARRSGIDDHAPF